MPKPPDSSLMQALYNCEINVTVSWFWDSGFNLVLGDTSNGIRRAGWADTWQQAEEWLAKNASEIWPKAASTLAPWVKNA